MAGSWVSPLCTHMLGGVHDPVGFARGGFVIWFAGGARVLKELKAVLTPLFDKKVGKV